jgi:outer membrane cobalamin receptor
MPFGVGADPWPEAKLVGKYKLRQPTEITLTTGYKGRVPSLRERFDLATGNPALGPEKALHLELRAIETHDRLRVEVAPFYRHTTGTARLSTDPADNGRLINLGTLDIYGIDVQGRGKVHDMVEVGASYNYVNASDDVSDDPLDRLPHNRFDVFTRLTPTAAISGLVRLKYYGESIDRMNTVEGYALLEGSVSWQISKEYLGVLRVDDALNVRPETRAGYHTAGRVIYVVLQGSWQ